MDNQQLKAFIEDAKLLDSKKLRKAYEEAEKNQKNLAELLLDKKLIKEEQLSELNAYISGINFVDLTKEKIDPEVLHIIPKTTAEKNSMVAYKKDADKLYVAMLNPHDVQTLDFVRKVSGLRIKSNLTTRESIQFALKQYEQSLEKELGVLEEKSKTKDAGDNDLHKEAEDSSTIKIVDTILKHAINQRASDIHIEPEEKDVMIRFRVDGILHDAMTLPKQIESGIVARIKVLSNLRLDEHRLPQDGRFAIKTDQYKVSFRVSILPVFDGEKVVMRLLHEDSHGFTLEGLGFRGKALKSIKNSIHKPTGMILATGPTGSGKTTTLYTVLDMINIPDVNISTIEDPIEYRMPRINQTQVRPDIGLTFANGLRSLVRQDPDIIMVGEIRDAETAETAVAAASTGHLVFSTLHTNNAAGTFPRLLTLGVNPKVISSAVTVAMAQRLARKLCPSCKKESALGAGDKKLVKDIVNSIRLDEYKDVQQEKMWVATGCQKCNETGYKGRIGIFEAIVMTPEIEEVILKNPSEHEVKSAAINQNILSMLQDGIVKALKGVTTMDELRRVLDFENEARSKQKNDADR